MGSVDQQKLETNPNLGYSVTNLFWGWPLMLGFSGVLHRPTPPIHIQVALGGPITESFLGMIL